jgi:hypothetical protein
MKLERDLLSYPAYSPDLALSTFCLFRALKDAIHNTRFEDDDGVIHTVKKCLHKEEKNWYWQGIHDLVSQWYKVIKLNRNYVERRY